MKFIEAIFPRGQFVKYKPARGKSKTGEVLGAIRHTRRYNGPQLILVYFPKENKSLHVKVGNLERITRL